MRDVAPVARLVTSMLTGSSGAPTLIISQICEKLREEGQIWSERKVSSDLHNDQAGELIDELFQQQLSDITLCGDDYVTSLKQRDLYSRKCFSENQTPRHLQSSEG